MFSRVATTMASCTSPPAMELAYSPVTITTCIGIVSMCLFYCLHICRTIYRDRKKARHSKSYDFFRLPPEIRIMIYDNVVGGGHYLRLKSPPPKPSSFLESLKSRWRPKSKDIHPLRLVNRQISSEYTDIVRKNRRYELILDKHNVGRPDLWPLTSDDIQTMKNCEIWIDFTSCMLGATDPRQISRKWEACDRICNMFQSARKLENLHLHIRAIPDALWNPLWLWHHGTQAFKTATMSKFNKITFDIEYKHPITNNHLARNKDGGWDWICPHDHVVCADSNDWQAVRDFAQSVFEACPHCSSSSPS